MQATRIEPREALSQVGKAWGWLLLFGALTLIAGIVTVAWPSATLAVIAVLFGIQLVITGIFHFVRAFGSDESGGSRVVLALLGALALIVGLYCIRHVSVTVVVLAVILGIFWVIHGTLELFAAADAPTGTPGRGWTGTIGGLSIVAGIVVLSDPHITVLALAWLLGIWLIVFGIIEIISAFAIRSSVRAALATTLGEAAPPAVKKTA